MKVSRAFLWKTAAQLRWLTHGEVPANPFSTACVVPGDPAIPIHEDICMHNSLAAAVYMLPLTKASLQGGGEEFQAAPSSSTEQRINICCLVQTIFQTVN